MIRIVVFCLLIGGALQGCNEEPSSCTKVFVKFHEGNSVLFEYEQLHPRQRAYGYLHSQYAVRQDSVEYIFKFDKLNYMDRSPDYAKSRGAVSVESYLAHCGPTRSLADTVYILAELGDGNYREFLVRDAYSLIHTEKGLTEVGLDGSRTQLALYNYEVGEFSPVDSKNSRQAVRGRTKVYCKDLYEITRFNRLDSISETYIQDIGLSRSVEPTLESRLSTINGEPFLGHVSEICN